MTRVGGFILQDLQDGSGFTGIEILSILQILVNPVRHTPFA
jgi:hypothetical protein